MKKLTYDELSRAYWEAQSHIDSLERERSDSKGALCIICFVAGILWAMVFWLILGGSTPCY